MDILILSSVLDTLSDFSFKDALSLAAIGYQMVRGRSQDTSPAEPSEIVDITSEESSLPSSQDSLISIVKDNSKNKLKALIQKTRHFVKSKAGMGMNKMSTKRSEAS